MNLGAFFVALVGPMFARLLASAGVSLVVMTGVVATAAILKAQVVSMIAGMPSIVLQLGGLFGIWEALGIVFGTYTFLMTWKATTGFIGLAKT